MHCNLCCHQQFVIQAVQMQPWQRKKQREHHSCWWYKTVSGAQSLPCCAKRCQCSTFKPPFSAEPHKGHSTRPQAQELVSQTRPTHCILSIQNIASATPGHGCLNAHCHPINSSPCDISAITLCRKHNGTRPYQMLAVHPAPESTGSLPTYWLGHASFEVQGKRRLSYTSHCSEKSSQLLDPVRQQTPLSCDCTAAAACTADWAWDGTGRTHFSACWHMSSFLVCCSRLNRSTDNNASQTLQLRRAGKSHYLLEQWRTQLHPALQARHPCKPTLATDCHSPLSCCRWVVKQPYMFCPATVHMFQCDLWQQCEIGSKKCHTSNNTH